MSGKRNKEGEWVYGTWIVSTGSSYDDWVTPFGDELEAYKRALETGRKVFFVPFGIDLQDVVLGRVEVPA